MGEKLRLGFIGAGFMGQLAHIANYAAMDDVALVALAEGRRRTADLVAARYGIPETYADHREMLARADLEAVVAILPYSLHHAVVPDVLAAGRHCLTEKPIAVSAETGRRLAEAARANGLVYQVGYMKRCDPASQHARALVAEWKASGRFGPLRYIRIEMPPGDWTLQAGRALSAGDEKPSYGGQAPEPMPAWMDAPTQKLYNAFINYYVHQLNLLRFLAGEDYQVRYADPSGVVLGAATAGGVPATLEMAAYTCRDHWEEAYTLCFEKGYVRLDLPAPMARQRAGRVRLYRGAGDLTAFEEPVLKSRWAMAEQARSFVDAVRGRGPNVSPPDEAVKDLEVAEQYVRRLLESRADGPGH